MDHPTIKSFRFCPACGSSKVVKADFKKIYCQDCQFNLYFNSSAAVAVILYNEKDEILIATRAREPGIDLLDLPGGFVDPFETAEAAAIREIKEELCIDIKDLKYITSGWNLYPYNMVEYQTVDIGFSCKIPSNTIMSIDPELQKIEWQHYKTINKSKIAFPSMFLILKDFIYQQYNFNLKG
jgi:NADH pyrophosphatase NudC (nudix superfamily)